MKWAMFLLGLFIGVPMMVIFLRLGERAVRAFILVYFIIALNNIDGMLSINIISFENYRGWSRGMEVTALDLMNIGLIIHLVTQKALWFSKPLIRPETWTFFLYGLVACTTIIHALQPLYAFFGCWKILRGIVVFLIFSQLIDRYSRVTWLVDVYALMCLYELPFVVLQKYVQGIYRATGTLPHMNTLGMAMNMLSTPVFAVFVLTRARPKIWHLPAIGAAVFNVISTFSRGALVSLGIGYAFCLSFLRRRHLTPARAVLLTIMGLAVFFGGIHAAGRIRQRFLEAPPESELTRVKFNQCAKAMVHDRPFGIGVNNFPYAIEFTAWGADAPLNPERSGRDPGVAHHIYLLTAAEQGYLGLLAYLAMIIAVMLRCLSVMRTAKQSTISAYAVGVMGGMISLHLQGFLEWVMNQTNIWFLFCAISGTMTALGRVDFARWHAANRRQAPERAASS